MPDDAPEQKNAEQGMSNFEGETQVIATRSRKKAPETVPGSGRHFLPYRSQADI